MMLSKVGVNILASPLCALVWSYDSQVIMNNSDYWALREECDVPAHCDIEKALKTWGTEAQHLGDIVNVTKVLKKEADPRLAFAAAADVVKVLKKNVTEVFNDSSFEKVFEKRYPKYREAEDMSAFLKLLSSNEAINPVKESINVISGGDDFMELTNRGCNFRDNPERLGAILGALAFLKKPKAQSVTKILVTPYNSIYEAWKTNPEGVHFLLFYLLKRGFEAKGKLGSRDYEEYLQCYLSGLKASLSLRDDADRINLVHRLSVFPGKERKKRKEFEVQKYVEVIQAMNVLRARNFIVIKEQDDGAWLLEGQNWWDGLAAKKLLLKQKTPKIPLEKNWQVLATLADKDRKTFEDSATWQQALIDMAAIKDITLRLSDVKDFVFAFKQKTNVYERFAQAQTGETGWPLPRPETGIKAGTRVVVDANSNPKKESGHCFANCVEVTVKNVLQNILAVKDSSGERTFLKGFIPDALTKLLQYNARDGSKEQREMQVKWNIALQDVLCNDKEKETLLPFLYSDPEVEDIWKMNSIGWDQELKDLDSGPPHMILLLATVRLAEIRKQESISGTPLGEELIELEKVQSDILKMKIGTKSMALKAIRNFYERFLFQVTYRGAVVEFTVIEETKIKFSRKWEGRPYSITMSTTSNHSMVEKSGGGALADINFPNDAPEEWENAKVLFSKKSQLASLVPKQFESVFKNFPLAYRVQKLMQHEPVKHLKSFSEKIAEEDADNAITNWQRFTILKVIAVKALIEREAYFWFIPGVLAKLFPNSDPQFLYEDIAQSYEKARQERTPKFQLSQADHDAWSLVWKLITANTLNKSEELARTEVTEAKSGLFGRPEALHWLAQAFQNANKKFSQDLLWYMVMAKLQTDPSDTAVWLVSTADDGGLQYLKDKSDFAQLGVVVSTAIAQAKQPAIIMIALKQSVVTEKALDWGKIRNKKDTYKKNAHKANMKQMCKTIKTALGKMEQPLLKFHFNSIRKYIKNM